MPTQPTLTLEMIKPSDFTSSAEGVLIARGFKVSNLNLPFGTLGPIMNTSSTPTNPDPGVYLKLCTYLAAQTPPIAVPSPFPNPFNDIAAYWINTLCLTKIEMTSLDAVGYNIGGRLVYSSPLPSGLGGYVIQFNNSTTISSEESYATAGGQNATSVWYQPGYSKTNTSQPSGANSQPVSVQKFVADRVLTVVMVFTAAEWLAMESDYTDIAAYINSDTWGSYPRGTWLFYGATATTTDFQYNYTVQFQFGYKINGWYPFGEFIVPGIGTHPPDSGVPQTLLAMSPPAVGQSTNINGLARFSEQYETAFSTLFSQWFTPNAVT